MDKHLFVGGPASGMVEIIPPNIKIVNIMDGDKHLMRYKRVRIAYQSKTIRAMTYDIFTPNGEQTPELKAEFERQLPHLLEQL